MLLKNAGATLPLAASAHARVLVTGPNANLSRAIATYYGGTPCGNNYWNMVDAVNAYVATDRIDVVPGVASPSSTDTSGIPAAVAAAKQADVVILVIGAVVLCGVAVAVLCGMMVIQMCVCVCVERGLCGSFIALQCGCVTHVVVSESYAM